MRNLQDKRVLIVGSGGTLGNSIASFFNEQRAKLALHYRSTKPSLKPSSLVFYLSKNLQTEADSEDLLNESVGLLGALDILIICLGDFLYKPLLQVTEPELISTFNSNLALPFYLCKQASKYLAESATTPRIVLFGYANASETSRAVPNIFFYQQAKQGLNMLVNNLANVFAQTNSQVRVNSISPGICEQSEFLPQKSKWAETKKVKSNEILEILQTLIQSESLNGCNIEIGKDWR